MRCAFGWSSFSPAGPTGPIFRGRLSRANNATAQHKDVEQRHRHPQLRTLTETAKHCFVLRSNDRRPLVATLTSAGTRPFTKEKSYALVLVGRVLRRWPRATHRRADANRLRPGRGRQLNNTHFLRMRTITPHAPSSSNVSAESTIRPSHTPSDRPLRKRTQTRTPTRTSTSTQRLTRPTTSVNA